MLAIAAVLLGASDVVGLDVDGDAVAAARRNAELNGVAGRLDLRVADLAELAVAPADVVLANLTVGLIRRHAGHLTALVAPGGWLVTSGFTANQAPLALDALAGFAVSVRDDEDDWVALTLVRR